MGISIWVLLEDHVAPEQGLDQLIIKQKFRGDNLNLMNKHQRSFIDKKSIKRGPFKDLYNARYELIEKINLKLELIENNIDYFYKNSEFTINDIILASHLWGLYLVPEFQFKPKMHQYLQKVRTLTKFDYFQDIWS